MSEKNKKKITISLIVVIAVALIWFLIISPLIEFKKSEKEVLNAGKRYFEVNKTYLPTGNRIKTISLKTLYNKDFIDSPFLSLAKAPYCQRMGAASEVIPPSLLCLIFKALWHNSVLSSNNFQNLEKSPWEENAKSIKFKVTTPWLNLP